MLLYDLQNKNNMSDWQFNNIVYQLFGFIFHLENNQPPRADYRLAVRVYDRRCTRLYSIYIHYIGIICHMGI